MKDWNRCLREVVDDPSLAVFKSRLDKSSPEAEIPAKALCPLLPRPCNSSTGTGEPIPLNGIKKALSTTGPDFSVATL